MSIKKRYIACIIGLAISSQSYAAGYQVSEHSAAGLGRAYAGDAAFADTAAVLARNPAAMTLFKHAEVSTVASVVIPSVNIYDHSFDQGAKNIAPVSFVPAGYYIQPINDKVAVGLALFSNYGVTTKYPNDFNAGSLAGKTSLETFNFNPNIAYRLNPHFSIGGGVSLVYANAEFNRRLGALSLEVPNSQPSDNAINLKGTSWGWGWNIGALYELDQNNRFGISYHSQVNLNFDGDFTDYLGPITGQPKNTVAANLALPLPAIAEFSGFHQLNSQWAISYSLQWTQYNKFKEIRATSSQCKPGFNGQAGTCLLKKENYKDTYRWAVGTTYTMNDEWTLRYGFALDQNAGQATLSIPDTDRYWYSAGATYHFNPDLSVDMGLSYIHSKKITFVEKNSTFTSRGKAYLAAAQLNYSF
ncbi:long-chain fatty acid outer membrane transporter [Photobacterium angustum]|uniref:Long-chain fatty acid transporter n=1 Tax=Photobacterium angustum TaxID=661 RepID=A0ABX5GY57_PHOAN|nr:outer membrane protein transport protein [Photobacterium angustum]KJG40669.1 long-chain fatty acid outer membrane transporter [Photobacterium angustum]PSX01977.1 long-chain fatty acid transporter [Photobacterium angustum]